MKPFNLRLLLTVLFLKACIVIGQQGHWQVLKTKSGVANRSECGLAVVNGKFYLIGGDAGNPQAVESFNPETLTCTKLAMAPVNMHHFQAVAYNNKVYVLEAFDIGGFPNQE